MKIYWYRKVYAMNRKKNFLILKKAIKQYIYNDFILVY